MTDEQLERAMEAELKAIVAKLKGKPFMKLQLGAPETAILASTLALAMRHPDFKAMFICATSRRISDALLKTFEKYPATHQVLSRNLQGGAW